MRILTFTLPIIALLLLPHATFAGSQTYLTPGTYTFTVPQHETLTVTVSGAGGSGADGDTWSYGPDEYYYDSWYGADGFDGSPSSFGVVTARGGEKGYGHFGFYRNGAGGTASGGSSNTTGAGGAGGVGGEYALNGTYDGEYKYAVSGGGGSGGRATKSYPAGQLTPGSTVKIVVGSGGAGGTAEQTKVTMEQPNHDESPRPVPGQGAAGKNGSVEISWTASPLQCDGTLKTFSTSGTFSVPASGLLTIQVLGGGGGGGGGTWNDIRRGGNGGDGAKSTVTHSSFGTITAFGGSGGRGGVAAVPFNSNFTSAAGVAGADSNPKTSSVNVSSGDILTISIGGGGGGGGGGGFDHPGPAGGNGGIGANSIGGVGGKGGQGCTWSPHNGCANAALSGGGGGISSGGGGGGGASNGFRLGGNGANGSISRGGDGGTTDNNPVHWWVSTPVPGGATPGAGGSGSPYGGGGGGAGAAGQVSICIPNSSAPMCSITFDENPLTSNSTTVRWTSKNADLFYIKHIGYVITSGSAKISQAGDYSGTVSGAGGKYSCAAVLTDSGSKGKCTGNAPQNAGLCTNDALGLKTDVSRVLVPSCTVRKCEYTCNPGYTLKNNVCIKNPPGTRYACNLNNQCVENANGKYTVSNCKQECGKPTYTCGGTEPPTGATKCGPNASKPNLVWNKVPTCTGTDKCEYTQGIQCGANEMRDGSTCVCKSGFKRDPVTSRCVSSCEPRSSVCVNNQWCEVTASCSTIKCGGYCVGDGTERMEIDANPRTVRSGNKTTVVWTSANYASCKVTENNPAITDSWSTRNGEEISSAIEQKTIYTLTCLDENNVTAGQKSVTVNVIPFLIER